ncbi:unnamed protein product [Clonostachys rosea]|uniref:Calcineurin-like phosphoesterase domain-containing protein n=1 Tax=Bionectria ochroleuca TaxID=29856 RepID=A0ABY6UIX4_BIOOC|nr:unnamed protein product [Clonostachys rosea]
MDFLDSVTRRLTSLLKQPPTGPRLQILSDIHLEVGEQYRTFTFPATAPFLILAGDTGYLSHYDGYLAFLEAQVTRFERVFLVLGNHEFYKSSYEETIEAAKKLEQEPSLQGKVVLLHRRRWDYDGDDEALRGFTILGCTLWSALPDESRELVQLAVSDFKHIKDWTAQRHHATHLEEAAWLREEVDKASGEKRDVLVVTHHAPSRKEVANPHKTGSPWFDAYSTELVEGSRRWPGVRAWVFGHTHYSVDFVRRGIRVYANQRGYVLPNSTDETREREQLEGKVERKPHGFDPAASVQLW